MSEPHGKFCWYELMTTNTDAAGTFYKSVLGWNLQDAGHPTMSYTLLKVGDHGIGGMMTLPEEASKGGARPGWMGYIWVRDLEVAVADVKSAGGAIHRPPDDIPGVGRFAVVADPQGAIFILFRHVGNQEAPYVAPGTPGYTGWHELHAGELESAFAFYSGQFGWTKGERFEMGGEMGAYQLFSTGDDQMGGMMNKMPVFPAPFWLYYFNVEDIDAAAARVTGAGGKILMGPHEVPGGSWILQGLDPQDATFALVGPKKT
ncbi:MAG: Glyoxalase/Bleomycin resistance protein/dioxygenase domain [Rhodospirillales bacterium]|nr:Glyoxalase/Bleomycin resistance protein/dioxygenase domain [Rhodospirillales bacterium]